MKRCKPHGSHDGAFEDDPLKGIVLSIPCIEMASLAEGEMKLEILSRISIEFGVFDGQ